MLEGPPPHVTTNVISSSLIPMPTQFFTLQLALKPVPTSWLECWEVKRAHAYLIRFNFGSSGSNQVTLNKLRVSYVVSIVSHEGHCFPWRPCLFAGKALNQAINRECLDPEKIRRAFYLQKPNLSLCSAENSRNISLWCITTVEPHCWSLLIVHIILTSSSNPV